ncbi:MAG TPA: MFS transporter [Stellaceae bacterium]|nr:MFS transporter [Stellaceae bacterium]
MNANTTGTCAWGVFQNTADPERCMETFVGISWLEYLRHHHRVTNADRVMQDRVLVYLQQEPKIAHFVGAELGQQFWKPGFERNGNFPPTISD